MQVSGFILNEIASESRRAIDKHGYRQTPMATTMPSGEKIAIVGEEFGEVCRCFCYDTANSPSNAYHELIQLAAMAAMWAHSLVDEFGADVTS